MSEVSKLPDHIKHLVIHGMHKLNEANRIAMANLYTRGMHIDAPPLPRVSDIESLAEFVELCPENEVDAIAVFEELAEAEFLNVVPAYYHYQASYSPGTYHVLNGG